MAIELLSNTAALHLEKSINRPLSRTLRGYLIASRPFALWQNSTQSHQLSEGIFKQC